MHAAFKALGKERERLARTKAPLWVLHDEAVQELLSDVQAGKQIFFSPNPINGATAKRLTMSSVNSSVHFCSLMPSSAGFFIGQTLISWPHTRQKIFRFFGSVSV
jgi:hypothetical protein